MMAGAALSALPSRSAAALQTSAPHTSALRTAALPGPAATVVRHLNEARIANGLAGLPEDPQLSMVSGAWSVQMAAASDLAHNPDDVGQYGLPVMGAGEIIGSVKDDRLSQDQQAALLVKLWLESPAHRPIVLEPAWTDIGVGVAYDQGGALYGTANFIAAALPALGQEALEFCQAMVADASAPRVVLGHSGLAADALAASGLADSNSPVLFARPDQALPQNLVEEIGRIVTPDTSVYLIGGKVSDAAAAQIAQVGATVIRLDGSSRYDTAARVAGEMAAVRGVPERIYLARADAWADAVSVGGQAALQGCPILLVDHDRVPDEAASVLQQFSQSQRVVIGGPQAVSDRVVNQVGASRLAGADRAATGAVVMREVWGRKKATAGEHLVITPGWDTDGWGTALAHGLYSARHHAPMLFVDAAGATPPVREVLTGMGYTSGTAPTVKFSRHVSAAAQRDILALTAN